MGSPRKVVNYKSLILLLEEVHQRQSIENMVIDIGNVVKQEDIKGRI